MDKKDFMNLADGTKITLKYKGAFTKYFDYIKIGEKIYCINETQDYGIESFYYIEHEFKFYKDKIYVENPYFVDVKVAKISKPIEFEILYFD